jgi:nanoRNase/pAp phosphatase (c-di-AMP/oligoRNAs hydrolase)
MKNLKQIFELCELKPVAFCIKGSPDPDSIASSFALLSYYRSLGGDGKIYHEDYVSHSANKAMVNILDIQLTEKAQPIQEEYYVVCDHADPVVEANCKAKCLLHIDHHKSDSVAADPPIAQFVEYDAGACSSIITRLLQEVNFFASGDGNLSPIATALCYGIKTDTDNFDGAREKDWEAMSVLSQFKNKDSLQKMTKSRISAQTSDVLKTALSHEKTEQNWLYAGVGFLQETYRDSIALVADEMLRRQGIDNVLVYGIIERESGSTVEGSVRSIDAGFEIDGFVRQFSDNAGGRKYKGGFQIPLGFWASCKNRDLLEDMVATCIEDKLKLILGTAITSSKKKQHKGE